MKMLQGLDQIEKHVIGIKQQYIANKYFKMQCLTSTMLMAIPYPTTNAAKSLIYGDPDKNLTDSPAPIFGLLFLPIATHEIRF